VYENELKYAAAEGTFAYHYAKDYLSFPLRNCPSKPISRISDRKISCAQVKREVIVTKVLGHPIIEEFTTDLSETTC
jgi:hypothetical protein